MASEMILNFAKHPGVAAMAFQGSIYQVYKLAKALNIEMSEFFIGINDSSEINMDEKKDNKIA